MTTTTTAVGQVLLPGQAAAPDGPVDLTMMWVMHYGFRRDLGAFPAAAARTPVGDRATWQALEQRWQRMAEILHKHHKGEDAGLWPLLLERVGRAGDAEGEATLRAMSAEHHEIDPLLEACAEGFARLAGHADEDARAALEVRLVAGRERLEQHLAHEERDAMVLVQRHLTPADWHRLDQKYFRKDYSMRDIPFVAAWGVHGLSAAHHQQRVRAAVGAPMMVMWRLFWRRSFERDEAIAFRYL